MSLLLALESAKSEVSVRENKSILGSIRKGTSSCRFSLHLCRPTMLVMHLTQISIRVKGMGLVQQDQGFKVVTREWRSTRILSIVCEGVWTVLLTCETYSRIAKKAVLSIDTLPNIPCRQTCSVLL